MALAAAQEVTPTTETNTTRPTVRSREAAQASLGTGTDAAHWSTRFRKAGDCEKPPKAVDPTSTARTDTPPGLTGMVVRWSIGLIAVIRPVTGLRRNGASRDTAIL
ncbi:hypothetical protein TUM20985_29110 [Mycobacterium antarcticum]|nr:hypothetical protein TUM20985_29110 [Mycolicibacterium sp. TUM20985]GLP84093.1 hypothetical protein TUM20984_55130 [Mycolicibacterium sp. TUM20984]